MKVGGARIAVIGAGIAGLGSLWELSRQLGASASCLTLFEKDAWLGGHAHTVDITVEGVHCPVDTGFLVYNERTYPMLTHLFEELGVGSVGTEMSFSVSVPMQGRMLEWAGTDLNALFAQRRNLVSSRFLRMLGDIQRFNKEATWCAEHGTQSDETLGEFLERGAYSDALRDCYLLPMAGAIWSCPTQQMLEFPMHTFARFCHNHALLQIMDRPTWRTVAGGSRNYVKRIIERVAPTLRPAAARVERIDNAVRITAEDGRAETFDAVIMASHADQSLAMLGDASAKEREVLGRFRFQPNHAVLHTDVSVLPVSRRAWAAWNYVSVGGRADARVSVNYLINKLQPLPFNAPVILSLNPTQLIDPATVLGEFEYAHPVLDNAAIRGQQELARIQGEGGTWFAGAWTGYGFHEDGLRSGAAAAGDLVRALAMRMALPHAA
jgi:predicted NAD/FAD-binding protein